MRAAIADLKPGDHVALFYRDCAEQFAAAIPYIQIGLERNERCLYIAGDNEIGDVVEEMEAAGIDVEREQKLGRLVVATPEDTYLRHGVFEAEKMVAELEEEIETTLRMGFKALRGTGELGWAARLPSALLRLYEYEELLDESMTPHFVALCQYNETLFSPALISQMIRVHPQVAARGVIAENPFYVGARRLVNNLPAVSLDEVVAGNAALLPRVSMARASAVAVI